MKAIKKAKKVGGKVAQRVIDLVMGNGLMQEENEGGGEIHITDGIPELMRECAAEGMVLLKNENQALPLKKEDVISVFGRCQLDWFYVGYGSGGDVHPPYKVSLMDGLKNLDIPYNEALAKRYEEWCNEPENKADHGWWGHWPYFHPEMQLKEEEVREAAASSTAAVIVIGRAAGEDRENVLKPGSYYLTEEEKRMLLLVCQYFSKTILIINSGNIIDMSFLKDYSLSAVLYAWQLGQESGNAVAAVLKGSINPSGKLSDTIAKEYKDYPSSSNFGNRNYNNYSEDIYVGYRYFTTFHEEKMLYPFGYGLSYTAFDIETVDFQQNKSGVTITVSVRNTGNCAGKEVVQVYCNAPEGGLSKAKKVLVGFEKTRLLQPQETQEITLDMKEDMYASYDDSGVTGFPDAFVLEAGKYRFYVGNSALAEQLAGSYDIAETRKLLQCEAACGVQKENAFPVQGQNEMQQVVTGQEDLKQRILKELPQEIPYTGNKGISLWDVKNGKHTMDEFIAQLSDRELGDLSHGEGGMGSDLGVDGNAGAFGGTTAELREKGIKPVITADGPAGLRIRRYTSLLPCGTAIACTWNMTLIEALFEKVGEEAAYFGVDVILSPGMNIHRNPLCGRNFEYYSEDPVLSGKCAAVAVRGIQKGGASACPKHFACNNQEVNRNYNDSRVSKRALREIYLKNFEICVKEGKPQNLMTSYNKINGVWSHYNYDLVTTILRKEWGYQGNVVTDWWMRKAVSPEFPRIKNNAYRVRAQVDVLMPGNMSHVKKKHVFDKEQLKTLGKEEGITRGELQRTARNVLEFVMTRMTE